MVGRSSRRRSARSMRREAAGPREGWPGGYIACLWSVIESSTRKSLKSRERTTRSGLETASTTRTVIGAGAPELRREQARKLADWEDFFQIFARPRDHVHPHQLSHAAR